MALRWLRDVVLDEEFPRRVAISKELGHNLEIILSSDLQQVFPKILAACKRSFVVFIGAVQRLHVVLIQDSLWEGRSRTLTFVRWYGML